MQYSFNTINIKKSKRPVWRLIKTTPANQFKDSNGSLFCFVEITNDNNDKTNGLELLVNTIFELHSRGNNFNSDQPEDNLEYLLDEANKKFTDICHGLEEGCFNDLTIVIGLVQNEKLVLSAHGKLESWMIHPSELKDKTKKFRWINMIKQTPATVPGQKLFTQIISGDLDKQQKFIVASKNIWQHFTQEKLKEIIINNPADKLNSLLTQAIDQTNQPTDLAIIIAQPLPKQSTNHNQATVSNPKSKIERPRTSSVTLPQKENISDVSPTTVLRAYVEKPKSDRLNILEKIIISFKNWFSGLTIKNKALFTLAIILFIVFIQSLSLIKQRQTDSDTTGVKFNEIITLVTAKQEEAEATLIYNDRGRAKDLLKEAITLALDLPSKNNQEKDIKASVINDLNKQLDQLNNITNVSYLTPAFILPNDIDPKQITNIYFFATNEALLITAEPKIVFVNLASGEITKKELTDLNNPPKLTTYDDENRTIYMVDNKNQLFKININNSAKPATELITGIDLPTAINNLVFYADKLYASDPENKQIIKIDLTKKQVSTWLSSPREEITGAIGMTIDSSIYLASHNSVSNFFKGAITDWHIKNLSPEPTNILSLHAKLNQDFIYLLEKDGKRIIKLKKDGEFIKQFATEKWTALNAFAVNNDGTEAMLLNNNEIYTLRLE